jgi:hypothetical protein
MQALSISRAWEETRSLLLRDGKLFASVALALISVPTAVSGLINPSGMSDTSTPLAVDLIAIIASVIALAGQLALIRLALGRGETVGAAIAHGLRRLPVYFVSVLLIVAGLVLLGIPFAAIMLAAGVPLDRSDTLPNSPLVLLLAVLYLAAACFFAIRFVLSAAVASAEPVGPIVILRHSWRLTAGNWWRLFGFVILFFIAAMVVLLAAESAIGVVARVTFGGIEPMSAGALVLALVEALLNAALTVLFTVMLASIYLQLSGRDEPQASVPSSGI